MDKAMPILSHSFQVIVSLSSNFTEIFNVYLKCFFCSPRKHFPVDSSQKGAMWYVLILHADDGTHPLGCALINRVWIDDRFALEGTSVSGTIFSHLKPTIL